jgi:tetratricopeptide (TPR) repeat protein
MNFINATLVYLLISRLAIVSAGIVSMVIGYRLFCRGIGVAAGQSESSTIESSFAGINLSLKNAAPGSAFALFGAVLISVMLIQSSPSVTWESAQKMQDTASSKVPNVTTETKLQMRGDNPDSASIAGLTNLGRELEKRGKTVEAARAYRQAVTIMAEPMNDLAWIYLNSGKTPEAVNLARLAVQLTPDESRFRDTLSNAEAASK